MCDRCDPFFLPVPVGSATAYRALVARLAPVLGEETLELVEASCPWAELQAGAPPRAARHLFACTACAQLFILERGSCSALGDQWRPLHGN
jgi:hypothetical protein